MRRRRGFLQTYLTPKASIGPRLVLVLGVTSFAVIIVGWTLLALLIANPFFLPTPPEVLQAEVDMILNQGFLGDVAWSTFRIVAGFVLAAVIAVPLGLLMGSFEAVRAFFQPVFNFVRYMPASAFIPLLILLQGLGENGGFLELLRGGQVQTIHTQEATLEDIFIRVTGRSLT